MCEERERLIGFVYDECNPAERAAIETHLAECHECRREVSGLRAVRQDLLAWEVPRHESVWRPLATPGASAWRAVPAWAMSAAAAAVFTVGAAGGAAVHALLPRTPVEPARAAATTETVEAAMSPSLAALEERLTRLEAANTAVSERVQDTTSFATPADVAEVSATTNELVRRVNALGGQQDDLREALLSMYTETGRLRTRQTGLEQNTRLILTSLGQSQRPAQGFGGSR